MPGLMVNWYKESQFKQIKQKLLELRNIISREVGDTKEMIRIYYKWLRGQATPQDISVANAQVKDLLKGSVLATLFAVPAGSLLIFALVKLAKRFGIELIPSFKSNSEDNKNELV